MASVSSNKSINIKFTDEEKKILENASQILKDIGKQLWHDDIDEESYFFSDLGVGISNALKGDYWMS